MDTTPHFFAEYYVYLRALAKDNGIEDAKMLNDEYLYAKADPQTLHTAYADVAQSVAQLEQGLSPPQAVWIHRNPVRMVRHPYSACRCGEPL